MIYDFYPQSSELPNSRTRTKALRYVCGRHTTGKSIERVFGSEEILKNLEVGSGGNDRREDVISIETE
jgi:hypothetical protein